MKPNIRSVDFNLLLLFDAIYRTRNLSVAGQAVGISPSAASHALARLRGIFNDPLFIRLPRGLEPTPLADRLVNQISTALDAIGAVFDQVTFDPRLADRTFRIAMTDIGENSLLPRLSAELAKQAPGILIETCAPSFRSLQSGMENGEVDLAYGFAPPMRGEIRQQRLMTSSYVCIARRGHPTFSGPPDLKTYLDASQVLAFTPGSAHGETIEKALREAHMRGKIAIKVRHFLAIPRILATTDLVATVPRRLAESFLPSWDINIFQAPLELPTYDVKQYWHERYHLDQGNQWLRTLIASLFVKQ